MIYKKVACFGLLIIGFVLVDSTYLIAMTKPRIAVLEADAKGVSETVGRASGTFLRQELVKTKRFDVLERESLEKVMQELKLQQTGCTDQACAIEIGKMLNAAKVVLININRLGGIIYLNARFVDVRFARIEFAVDAKASSEEQVPNACELLAQRIVSNIPLVGAVVDISGEIIYVDLGADYGINTDTKFNVFRLGKEILNDAGELVMQEKEPIASLKIISVDAAGCKARAVASAKPVEISDVVEPVKMKIEKGVSTGAIKIATNPANARITINGKYRGLSPLSIPEIEIGEYNIQVMRDDCQPYNGKFVVLDGQLTNVQAQLTYRYGSLNISSEPTGAEVRVDGEDKGLTPLIIENIPIGNHVVTIVKEKYGSYSKEVLVKEGRLLPVMGKLAMRYGMLSVISEPAGTVVYLDNTAIGKTPLELPKQMIGVYRLRVYADKYRPWQQQIQIDEMKKSDISVKLERMRAKANIATSPAGANVFVNGSLKGKTPLTLSDLPTDDYEIIADLEGYYSVKWKADLAEEKEYVFNQALKMKLGKIFFTGTPSGAAVIYKEKEIGKLPLVWSDLKPGQYEFKVQKLGYEPGVYKTIAKGDETVNITAGLTAKTRGRALLKSVLLPGSGQRYTGYHNKGNAYSLLQIASFCGAIWLGLDRSDKAKTYDEYYDKYQNTIVNFDAYADSMTTAFDDAQNADTRLKIGIGFAAGVYLWNLVDAYIFMPDQDEPKTKDPKTGLYWGPVNNGLALKVRF